MKYLGSGKNVRIRTFGSKRLFFCQAEIPGKVPGEAAREKTLAAAALFDLYLSHIVAECHTWRTNWENETINLGF
jgi:hypothetical protein